jgi:serine/threonine protein kinase
MPASRSGSGDLVAAHPLSRGRYVIRAKIAQGGMSAIYEAQDTRLQNRVVAIKEMNEQIIEPSERSDVLTSFRQEAEMLAQLDHLNLVKVFDLFEENGRHYMVMEFVPGRSLLEILETDSPGGLPEDRVLTWAEQLCDVLAYLHGQKPQIIYRDLKPGNVMEDASTTRIKLIDFGIARIYKPGKRKDTITFGTEGYAPPEQFGSTQTDERSDVYALGATLHQLLTGYDPSSKLFTFPSVRSLNSRVSQRVSDAIGEAVAVKAEDRFASMTDMKAALLGGAAISSRSPPKPSPSAKGATPTPTQTKSPAKPKPKPKPPPGAKLSLSQARLDFGQVRKGEQPTRKFTVTAGGSGASLSTGQRWLTVEPTRLRRDRDDVQVTLRTELMSFGRKQWPVAARGEGLLDRAIEIVLRIAMAHARLIVPVAQAHRGKVSVRDKKRHRLDVTVTVTLAPHTGYTLLGWAGVVGAMLLEVLIIGLIIGAMLGGWT